MNRELLKLLYQNATYTNEDLAEMLGSTPKDIAAEIKQLEKEGVICGYKAIIDWEKLDEPYVSAMVELNVVPKASSGFEDVASYISSFKEVESLYLTSGNYDLCLLVKGKTLQEVARFVARELATIESVTSTATHFVMRRYKEMDLTLCKDDDDRGQLFV